MTGSRPGPSWEALRAFTELASQDQCGPLPSTKHSRDFHVNFVVISPDVWTSLSLISGVLVASGSSLMFPASCLSQQLHKRALSKQIQIPCALTQSLGSLASQQKSGDIHTRPPDHCQPCQIRVALPLYELLQRFICFVTSPFVNRHLCLSVSTQNSPA